MDRMIDTPIFRSGSHVLPVIHTDLTESESLLKKIAGEEQEANPGMFAGLSPCVYFKMPYVQPCENFRELRKLILRIRENTGLRADYRGIVAIEATEWIGHEREEYFTIVLKFLFDHRDIWRSAMILNDCRQQQLQRFVSACARYVMPKLIDLPLFRDGDALRGLIRAEFQKHSTNISLPAAGLLAEAMAKPELKEVRSLAFLERTVREIISCNDFRPQVTKTRIENYLLEPDTTLTLLAGQPLYDRKEWNLEKDGLQL